MTSTEIRNYWDERALLHPEAATTDDVYLREIEFRQLANEIEEANPRSVLDLGCGDGLTTIRLADRFPLIRFTGMDFSQSMLGLSGQNSDVARAKGWPMTNVEWVQGDILQSIPDGFGMVVSCRCLINLPTAADQRRVLDGLRGCRLALIENFKAPHEHLNSLRADRGLPMIPIRGHNCFFEDDAGTASFADSYYYATRITYAMECAKAGRAPRYDSEEHRAATELANNPELYCAPMRLIRLYDHH